MKFLNSLVFLTLSLIAGLAKKSHSAQTKVGDAPDQFDGADGSEGFTVSATEESPVRLEELIFMKQTPDEMEYDSELLFQLVQDVHHLGLSFWNHNFYSNNLDIHYDESDDATMSSKSLTFGNDAERHSNNYVHLTVRLMAGETPTVLPTLYRHGLVTYHDDLYDQLPYQLIIMLISHVKFLQLYLTSFNSSIAKTSRSEKLNEEFEIVKSKIFKILEIYEIQFKKSIMDFQLGGYDIQLLFLYYLLVDLMQKLRRITLANITAVSKSKILLVIIEKILERLPATQSIEFESDENGNLINFGWIGSDYNLKYPATIEVDLDYVFLCAMDVDLIYSKILGCPPFNFNRIKDIAAKGISAKAGPHKPNEPEEEDAEKEGAKEAAAVKSESSGWSWITWTLIISGSVVVLVIGGMAYWFFFRKEEDIVGKP